jgi:UDP-N-acetylglucosamine--N-acetylmuramyl-(pentapeptide) pyrophosphoryl-undecaprenol N-acetylglucosamine transferase
MRILAVGGGSGGHVTPVVAVLKEIRKQQPHAQLRFWCDFSFYAQARATVDVFDATVPVHRIVAGKLRRYNHLTVMQQLLWPALVLKNIRDGFLVLIGFVQSFFKLIIWRPDVIFTKGGYVCLPVGIAAHVLRIPLVIHDSDAHPGLTNRILSRWATSIGTGAPLEFYHYDKKRSHYVGIPVDESIRPLNSREQKAAKREWGIDPERPLLVVTGGGLGAQRINNVISTTMKQLLEFSSVVLISGTAQYEELKGELPENSDHFQLHSFVTGMPTLLGAADVVVTRAGATTLLELAALKKPAILIPNAKLTGGHQLKNANVYAAKKAVVVLNEETVEAVPARLVEAVKDLLDHPKATNAMAARFYTFSRPNAAKDMAALILGARTV